MALVLNDRVKETTTTSGLTDFALGGSVTGFQTFSAGIGNSNTTYYAIADGSDWEVGLGTLSSDGLTLARTTILESSNADAKVSFATGSKQVFCTYPADKAVLLDASQTLSNKRINLRINTAGVTSGTITPNGDTTDVINAYGLTGPIIMAIPSGTPVDGQRLMIRLEDNGTGRGITWTGTSGGYRAVGVTLPTATTASKLTYVGCVYNSTDLFWDVIAVTTQA